MILNSFLVNVYKDQIQEIVFKLRGEKMSEKYPNEKKDHINEEKIYLNPGAAYDPNLYKEPPTEKEISNARKRGMKNEIGRIKKFKL